ncbi:unnamed protein product [Durusdinium trenchii]|uniref:peptidylprolyl isomerase n=1 Tax=Durusdinium trenchii TaxID=1381693 RepID=A0ABP0HY31_9DINO
MAVTSRRPHVLRALAALAFAASWVSCARALEMVFAPMRRDVWLGFSSLVGLGGPARALVGSTLSPDIEEVVNAPSTGKDFKTMADGLQILDLATGKGDLVKGNQGLRVWVCLKIQGDECCSEGDIVVVDWSLRKSNGYFVDASFGFDPGRGIDEKFGVGSPELRFSPKGDKGDQVIEGIRRALIGMRVGGTRRVIVPPSLGFVKEELKPKPVDWGRQTQIQRAKNKNFVVELRLKALRP